VFNLLSKYYMEIKTYWRITIKLRYVYFLFSTWSQGLWSIILLDSYFGVRDLCIDECWFIVGSIEKVVRVDSPT